MATGASALTALWRTRSSPAATSGGASRDGLAPAPLPVDHRLASLRIGVLYNPLGGINRRARRSLREAFGADSSLVFRDAVDPDSAAQALREMADRQVDAVAISGGDGTISAALGTLLTNSPFERMPLLALLRGGTANMTAGDIGLAGRQARALRTLIERTRGGGAGLGVVARPALRVDPGDGRAAVHGFFFGAAAISQGIDYCKQRLHSLGLRGEVGPGLTLLRFALAVARGERRVVSPVRLGVTVDGASLGSFDCTIAYVTTLERMVLGIRPYWGQEAAPLHFSAARASPRHWLRALPGVLRGRPNRWTTLDNGYLSHNAFRLELAIDAPVHVDGEVLTPAAAQPLLIEATAPIEFLQLK